MTAISNYGQCSRFCDFLQHFKTLNCAILTNLSDKLANLAQYFVSTYSLHYRQLQL